MGGTETSGPAATAVELRGIGRRFSGRWALAHVDLAVRRGETVLLAGPNGSGKTTLLRTVSGLCRPTTGELTVLGLDPARERTELRRKLALVSHTLALYPRLSARETLELWLRLAGDAAAALDVERALADVGLAGVADEPVGGFSAGMKKRLALARARLQRPELVLLDEPFAALDAEGGTLVENWLAAWKDAGVTVLLASHALERCGRICDRAVRLDRGQIDAVGSGSEAASWA